MLYDENVGNLICERLVEGLSLRTITKAEDMPSASTVFKWLSENQQFAEQYAHAREAQADTLADEIIDIADDASNDTETVRDKDGNDLYDRANSEWINRSKLRVDARKWVAAKLKPKKYGDRLDLTSGGDKLMDASVLAAANERARKYLEEEAPHAKRKDDDL